MNKRTLSIGRQPILDQRQNVAAYELLYRGSGQESAIIENGDVATCTVLSTALADIGIERVAGDLPVFVNFTEPFLYGTLPIPLGPERVVIEVLEHVTPDDRLADALASLSSRGYRLALDDFVYRREWDTCLDHVNIVKLDVQAVGRDQIREQVRLLSDRGVALLAEKVETREEFEYCRTIGFQLFQGYFFLKPTLIEGKSADSSKLALTRILSALADPEIDAEQLERYIAEDATLARKLMKFVNSCACGLRSKVESLRHAIHYLGLSRVKMLATLLFFVSVEGKPHALLQTALIRALACQNLAKSLKYPSEEAFFSAGLFSVLDALLDQKMAAVVQSMPFTDELALALVCHEGIMGECLAGVIAFEEGRLEDSGASIEVIRHVPAAFEEALIAVESGDGSTGRLGATVGNSVLAELCGR
jgi:EAL and modified HD-GYP domain-containing signal transduction protein